MINAPNNIFNNWNKVCYIARKLPPSEDEFGNELDNVYEEPQKMIFNYQPVKDESELRDALRRSNGNFDQTVNLLLNN